MGGGVDGTMYDMTGEGEYTGVKDDGVDEWL
jgi:hypothetical protein